MGSDPPPVPRQPHLRAAAFLSLASARGSGEGRCHCSGMGAGEPRVLSSKTEGEENRLLERLLHPEGPVAFPSSHSSSIT